MKLERLKQLQPYLWTLPGALTEHRAEVLLYGTAGLLKTMDDKVLEQIANVARLPGLVGAAITMPDAHWGYGFPIGGVAAFDAEQGGVISAGGVGFDISCGIRCLRSNIRVEEAAPHFAKLADTLYKAIPAGVGEEGHIKMNHPQLDQVLRGGAQWAVGQGYGSAADLEYVEEQGCAAGAVPENVSELAKSRQRGEMGTLGSGNHYLEVQVVDCVLDADAADAFGLFEGQLIISIHCGSRGLGHQIGTDYLVMLAKAASRLGIALPDRELACAPIQSPEGQRYIGAMNAAINCALANRQILTHLTREACNSVYPDIRLETLFDVSHNTCKKETHEIGNEQRQHGEQFFATPGVRYRDDDIVGGDHAQIAMRGLGSMHEVGRRAGAGQRRGQLAADVAGFADAGDNDPPVSVENQLDRAMKTIVQTLGQRRHSLRFDAQHAAREGQTIRR